MEALKNCTSVTSESRVRIGPAIQPFPIADSPKLHLSPLSSLGKAGDLSAVSLFALLIDYPPCALLGFGKEVNEVWLRCLSARLGH
jgi:hypothetical protein